MNVYDSARDFVLAVKETDEYKEYMEAKEKVSVNSELVEALNDYQEKQFDLQKQQLAGVEITTELLEGITSSSEILMRDPLAAEYLQAQMRYMMMIGDLYKTLGEVMMI